MREILHLVFVYSLLLSPFGALLAVAWYVSSRMNHQVEDVLVRMRVQAGGIHSKMAILEAKVVTLEKSLQSLTLAPAQPLLQNLDQPRAVDPERQKNLFKHLLDYTD